jgi:RNA polymerase sigma-70 factor (ECF subfamily)
MVGSDDGFETFFRAQFPQLVLYLRLRGYEQYAADAAQEALAAAARNWHSVDAPSAWVRTAALRIAQRLAVREAERARRDRAYVEGSAGQEPCDPARAAELTEEQRVVLKKMQALPAMRRAVIALTMVGYSTGEIARELGIADATVRSHLRHARRALGQPGGAS